MVLIENLGLQLGPTTFSSDHSEGQILQFSFWLTVHVLMKEHEEWRQTRLQGYVLHRDTTPDTQCQLLPGTWKCLGA